MLINIKTVAEAADILANYPYYKVRFRKSETHENQKPRKLSGIQKTGEMEGCT